MGDIPAGMTKLKGNDDPYSVSVRSKLKGSSSPRRKVAQQILGINKMKNPEKREARLLELVRNPEASALQIQKVIGEMLERTDLHDRTKVELIGKVVQAHTAIHGAKTKNLNINVNLDSVINTWRQKRLEKDSKILQIEQTTK
jgi:hypothetical protein